MRESQSDLSLASALFYGAGALFSLLSFSLFRADAQLRYDVLTVGVSCAAIVVIVLIRGSRITTLAAGTLMSFSFAVVLYYVWVTPHELRALNSGLLFYPLFIYLVWFTPMWYARLVGYSWIAAYCLIVNARFGPEMLQLLVTLAVTGLTLGELIGRFKKSLERTSITDPLCEVWNKRGFAKLLSKAVTFAQRTDTPLSLLYIDLDDFKRINDDLGHAEGDRVLREFASSMQSQIRPQDVFARFGGDEFALLLSDCDAEHARQVGERLQLRVAVTDWSFGVSEWGEDESADEFISRADLLMLRQKQGRKGQLPESAER